MKQQKQTRDISKFRLFLTLIIGIFISLNIGDGQGTLIGTGSLILTIPGVWFGLGWLVLIIQYIWEFILDRITEIANAVNKGKQVKADKTK